MDFDVVYSHSEKSEQIKLNINEITRYMGQDVFNGERSPRYPTLSLMFSLSVFAFSLCTRGDAQKSFVPPLKSLKNKEIDFV